MILCFQFYLMEHPVVKESFLSSNGIFHRNVEIFDIFQIAVLETGDIYMYIYSIYSQINKRIKKLTSY